VGRFARGWRRLPGKIPGQPQTRLRARTSIDTTSSRERTRRREQDDVVDAGAREHFGARRRRRSGRQDVVHQDDATRGTGCAAADRLECAAHGHPPLVTGTSRLRSGRHRSTREPADRQSQPVADGFRERPRLVVPAFGQPASRERHPGDRVGGRWTDRDHGVGERGRHASPTRELQPMDRGSRGPGVQERRPGDAHRRRRAVAAALDGDRPGAAAPLAPRWSERLERRAACLAERPASHAAARASRREHHVEPPREHGRTLTGATDTRMRARAGPARWEPGCRGRRCSAASASA
jgi:hypothetical protein